MMRKQPLDLATIQAQEQSSWRSLAELADPEAIQELLQREFPGQASADSASLSRRNFLKLMGASLALAGLTACSSQPPERIVPHIRAAETRPTAPALFFATAMPLGGYATGLLVQSYLGRPLKIEGNPDHPASLGGTDAWTQASILTLYDTDRAKTITRLGEPSGWDAFVKEVQPHLERQRARQGAGLRILTESITSPSLASQFEALLADFPQASWHHYEPINRDNVYAGGRLAFGEAVEPIYRFDQAEVILSLEADFLATLPGHIRYARDFAARRRVNPPEGGAPGGEGLNRLYAVESTPSLAGVSADHRWPLPASQIESFARILALELGIAADTSVTADANAVAMLQAIPADRINAIARDLQAHPGATLVLAGDHQPPIVHALVHAINHQLGNVGQTVFYTEPVLVNPVNQTESLRDLVTAMTAGQVELLLILGGNPVFNAPVDLNFAEALKQVGFRLHLGLYADETSALCHWHIPESHYLEAWGDGRAYDGTISLIQPLIEPLYESRSAHELLAVLLDPTQAPDVRSGHDIVRAYWASQHNAEEFESFWRTALHDGLIAGTQLPPKPVELKLAASGLPAEASQPGSDLEISFRPDPSLWDGRFANNGWLQELPQPLTKLTWDNAALISPLTAQRLGLATGDLVELDYRGQVIRTPLWLMPGQAEDSVTLHLGYGRTQAGRVGSGVGVNAYALRRADAPWFGPGLTLRTTGQTYPLATTQLHASSEGRALFRVGTLAQFQAEPDFAQKLGASPGEEISLYPTVEARENAWGMVVDLNACTGCNACVVACQAENNIPIVGKTEVLRGRAMHWLRLDRYYQGDPANPHILQQPVMCMHCEHAPCEVVCPVAATLHDQEGLNVMVYNRCIGTRYCSNNCPYKVRRFNFLQYTDLSAESLKLQRNPQVTVRARGVMEKCTYCIQRISAARIAAKKENRPIRDGEVVTACQAACPSQALVFGNLNDPTSQVAQLKASPLNYGLLTELNTRPRTTYLAKLTNPNPELSEGEDGG
jgi:molybdopterin-containing oxidoreductase family iron-sulfur binding subunit